MNYTRQEAIQILLKSYQAYYNITLFDEEQKPLTALCEYFEHSEKYVLHRKAELWSANCEEFLYLFDVPHLTLEVFEQCKEKAYQDGSGRMNIGPGHMYSYITPIFVCDQVDEDARKALKKCRIYKSFHFSLHGWMDFHAALVDLGHDRFDSNRAGKTTVKILKKVLLHQKK